jgi:hypothetical protein
VVQDKALECNGYRRLFTQDVVIPAANSGKEFSINLPRTGLLDSIYLQLESGLTFSDFSIEKDDETFPLKSTFELEQMVAQLNNDETFASDWVYADLKRPIMAESAKSLKLKLTPSLSAAKTLHLMMEYVNFMV